MRVKKILIFLCLMLLLVITNCFPVKAAGNGLGNSTRRSIAIVFDNSDSMVRDSGKKHEKNKYLKRWAQATYALRTVIHMVDENDIIHLYTVDNGASNADKGVVKKGKINKAISEMGVSYVTKMYGVRKAYRWVNNQQNTEKWVVILTDGKFYRNGRDGKELSADQSIGPYINKYKNYGVNTICVGLGLDKKTETELKRLDDGEYCSVFCTSKSKRNSLKENEEINENILKISKKIYAMEKLDDSEIRGESNLVKNDAEFKIAKNGTLTWKTDTEFSKYIREIIVMAQVGGFVKKKDVGHGMDVIYSDQDFAWGDREDIKQFNRDALDYYGNYSYLIDRKLIKKINSSCYIQHYSGDDLKGKKIKFELPKGKNMSEYTYQIYYVLSTEFIPTLKQGKTELVAEEQDGFITEGDYKMEYHVISPEGESLSKSLLAVRKAKRHVELKVDDEIVKPGSNKNFTYKEIKNSSQKKNNQYVVSVSYNKSNLNKFCFSVEPDLEKYELSFQGEEQEINIDKENENKILLKLTGKDAGRLYYWLRSKINGKKQSKSITYRFKNRNNENVPALGIWMEEAEIVRKEDFIKIGLPVEIVDPDGIKMDEHYQFSVSVQGKGEAELAVKDGDIHITQEEPEIRMWQDRVTVIEKIRNNGNFNISAYVLDDKEIDVEIIDVELTPQAEDRAGCFSFEFNKKSGKIICKANINSIRYFFSGIHNDKLSYKIHLKRNGSDYIKELEPPEFVKFRWKVNRVIWIFIFVLIAAAAAVIIYLSLSIQNGSLLFDEYFCNNYKPGHFFIVWLSPLGQELTVDNKISKRLKTISLSPRFDKELKDSLEGKKVVLGGRKKGYYLRNFRELNKIPGIHIENTSLEYTGKSITIELQNQGAEGSQSRMSNSRFQILYKNRREKHWAWRLFACSIVLVVAEIIYFLVWLNS